jgi:hypothetical protein
MYTVIVDHEPSQTDNEVVREGLVSFNEKTTGEPRDKEFSIFLKNSWKIKMSRFIALLAFKSMNGCYT